MWERIGALFPDRPVRDGADPLARLSAPDAALELAGRYDSLAAALREIPL